LRPIRGSVRFAAAKWMVTGDEPLVESPMEARPPVKKFIDLQI
jgi:hypothetical protein